MTVFTNEFSEEVWRTTHKWSGDKTIEDTHRRVAKTIASIEKTEELRKEWEEKFYDLLSDFKGSAGGRILSNAGTDWAGTTFINCFVGSLPDKDLDSLEGIYQVLLEQAKTLKSEGGWGMNFSWMRPRGSFIKGIGVDSPGAVKFMELFDKSSEIVTAGSGKKASNKNAKGKIRKGAMMGVLDCTHPDVIEFITAKQNSDRLSKFNISVNCTSEFMDLVSKGDPDLDWNLEFPDTEHERYRSEWNGDLKLWKSKGYPTVIHNTVKALWLWNLIMESTYNRNDPGVLFLDRANEFNPLSYKETILSTNPCVTGETKLLTRGGYKRIDALVGTSVEIWNGYEWSEVVPKVTGVNQSIYEVCFSNGSVVNMTPYHKIVLEDGSRVEIKDVVIGSRLVAYTLPEVSVEDSLNKKDIGCKKKVCTGVWITSIYLKPNIEPKVYCFTDTKNNTGIFSGVLLGNCGEQTLAPGGVCCLGSLNLTQFVDFKHRDFDTEKLSKYTKYMVRFLDNVNQISGAPLPEYVSSMRDKRRIGIGVMGWGSSLYMLRTRFGSKNAAKYRHEVMSTIARSAYEASIDLAIEKGKFHHCNPELHANSRFVRDLGLSDDYMAKLKKYGIRNSSLLSIQPTGNTAIECNNVSGGMEPVFSPTFVRTSIVPQIPDSIRDVTPKFHEGDYSETSMFKKAMEGKDEILRGVDKEGAVYKIDRNRGLTKETVCKDYGVQYLEALGIWDPIAPWAVSTSQLTVEEHIEDLKGFARWVDSACSKTVNLPYEYPYEDFKSLYLQAYNTGVIKGLTTYRAGTMTSVLSAVKETPEVEEEIVLEDIKLPDSLPASFKTMRAEGRKWYLTAILNENSTRPVALFVHTNNAEKNVLAENAVEKLLELARQKGIPEVHVAEVEHKIAHDTNVTKITRALGLNLRHGVLIRNIVSELDKVECFAGSFLFHIRKYLSTFIKDGEKVSGEKCPECGSEKIVYQEGCKMCISCGNSKCG